MGLGLNEKVWYVLKRRGLCVMGISHGVFLWYGIYFSFVYCCCCMCKPSGM